jgi:hypothetical protein
MIRHGSKSAGGINSAPRQPAVQGPDAVTPAVLDFLKGGAGWFCNG